MKKTLMPIAFAAAAFVAVISFYEAGVSLMQLYSGDAQLEEAYRSPAKANVAAARKLNRANGIDAAGVERLCKKSDSLTDASNLFSMRLDNLMVLPDQLAGSPPVLKAEQALKVSEQAKQKARVEVDSTMKRDLAGTTGQFMLYQRMQARLAREVPTTATGYPKVQNKSPPRIRAGLY